MRSALLDPRRPSLSSINPLKSSSPVIPSFLVLSLVFSFRIRLTLHMLDPLPSSWRIVRPEHIPRRNTIIHIPRHALFPPIIKSSSIYRLRQPVRLPLVFAFAKDGPRSPFSLFFPALSSTSPSELQSYARVVLSSSSIRCRPSFGAPERDSGPTGTTGNTRLMATIVEGMPGRQAIHPSS